MRDPNQSTNTGEAMESEIQDMYGGAMEDALDEEDTEADEDS